MRVPKIISVDFKKKVPKTAVTVVSRRVKKWPIANGVLYDRLFLNGYRQYTWNVIRHIESVLRHENRPISERRQSYAINGEQC